MSKQISKEESKSLSRLYADIARAYLKSKKVYRFHMKKVENMDDEEVIQKCHFWYENNRLVTDYKEFESKMLSEH